MSSYTKLVIFILVLLLISAGIIFLDSSVDTINKSIPSINEDIEKGNDDYNDAVELLNNKNYTGAMNKATSASNYYNSSLKKLSDVKSNFNNDINNVHKSYINAAYKKVQIKIKAINSLTMAINYYEDHYNSTGNTYALEANDYMNESLQYQDSRNQLVSENPNLFK